MSNDKFEVECYDLDTKKLARVIKRNPANLQPYTVSDLQHGGSGLYCLASYVTPR